MKTNHKTYRTQAMSMMVHVNGCHRHNSYHHDLGNNHNRCTNDNASFVLLMFSCSPMSLITRFLLGRFYRPGYNQRIRPKQEEKNNSCQDIGCCCQNKRTGKRRNTNGKSEIPHDVH